MGKVKNREKSIHLRELPPFLRKEEVVNSITHTVGGAFALVSLLLCLGVASWHRNVIGIISGLIYGFSMITVYVVSSVYHGLDGERHFKQKIVMRIIDHCDIYGLIVGTFAPIALTGIRRVNPTMAWISFGFVCLTATIGIIFTAIDFTRFKVVSNVAYFLAGWSVLMSAKQMLQAYPKDFFVMLIAGGVVYTSGMIFFVLQDKGHRFSHSIFHLFIIGGSIIQFIAIIKYCM